MGVSISSATPVRLWLRDVARLLPVRVRHWSKFILGPERRHEARQDLEVLRLRKLPRYTAGTTELLGAPFEFLDAPAFLEMYGEVFTKQIYAFETTSATPYIIDGGANIGLTILYFKRRFPNARVVGFEPDAQVLPMLKRNLLRHGCSDVELVPCALSGSEGNLEFMSEGSYAGRLARTGDSHDLSVPSVRLRKFLDGPVDLLKLNIEGAEADVLVDCADLLGCVQRIAVECHSFAGEPQSLHRIFNVLADSGFRVYAMPTRSSPQPFVRRDVVLGIDFQMYLFAYRA